MHQCLKLCPNPSHYAQLYSCLFAYLYAQNYASIIRPSLWIAHSLYIHIYSLICRHQVAIATTYSYIDGDIIILNNMQTMYCQGTLDIMIF